MEINELLGNQDLLNQQKTAFLCSRKVPAGIILKCYDWAIEQREAGNCVISGFHSQIERDVFHYLAKGNQPIIIAMARGIPSRLPDSLKKPINSGQILIVSPFAKNVTKVTTETAEIRNRLMIDLANQVVLGHIDPNGNLFRILKDLEDLKGKQFININNLIRNH